MRAQVRSFTELSGRKVRKLVVMKDDPSKWTMKSSCFGGSEEHIFKHARERVTLSAALTATNESGPRCRYVRVHEVIDLLFRLWLRFRLVIVSMSFQPQTYQSVLRKHRCVLPRKLEQRLLCNIFLHLSGEQRSSLHLVQERTIGIRIRI